MIARRNNAPAKLGRALAVAPDQRGNVCFDVHTADYVPEHKKFDGMSVVLAPADALDIARFIVENADGPLAGVTVPTRGWARWPEVEEYARVHGISLQAAIMRLVNSGLSHQYPANF
jgi:hypothetical protein